MNAQRWSEAEEPLLKATATLLKSVGVGHQETVYSHYRLGLVLQKKGSLAEAEQVLRVVLNAKGETLGEGGRYEWMRYAVASLLGSVQLDGGQAAEAKAVIPAAGEALLRLAPKLGVRSRVFIVGAALDRCVHLYETLSRTEPAPEHAAALEDWKRRRNEFLAAQQPGPKTP